MAADKQLAFTFLNRANIAKLVSKYKDSNNNEVVDLYRQRLPKTMEFGFQMNLPYSKHIKTSTILGIFHNEIYDCYVSFSEKDIHIWKENGKQLITKRFHDETGSHAISTMVHSKLYSLYLVISTDFKMHIFSESLFYIGFFTLKTRLVKAAVFYEERS